MRRQFFSLRFEATLLKKLIPSDNVWLVKGLFETKKKNAQRASERIREQRIRYLALGQAEHVCDIARQAFFFKQNFH